MIRPEWIFDGQPPIALETAWTVPEGHRVILTSLILSNASGSSKTFGMRIVRRGIAVDDSDYLIENLPVASGVDPKILKLSQVVVGGDRIQWIGQDGVRAFLSGMDNDTF